MIIVAWLTSKLGALGAKIALGAAAAGTVAIIVLRWMASLRREGAQRERARIGDAWRQHEDRVVQDVERGRADGPAGARERLRDGAAGDGA